MYTATRKPPYPTTLDFDDEPNMHQFGSEEPIVPNTKLQLVGTAHLTLKAGGRKVSVGSVVETGSGALLLWLHTYPLGGQDVEVTFSEEQGSGTNDVGVVLDHTQFTVEFIIGSAIFAGKSARILMFGLPTLPCSLLIQGPPIEGDP